MINYQRLRHWRFADVAHTYSVDDTMHYALALGCGQDPTDERQLQFVNDTSPGLPLALPTFAVVLGYPGSWMADPETGIDFGQIAYTHQRVALAQADVERGIALGGELTVDVEGPVNHEQGVGIEDRGQARKQGHHLCPAHDVQGVGREGCIESPANRPGLSTHIQHQRLRRIGQCGIVQPVVQTGKILRALTRLPAQVGKRGCEMHGVLARAATDLQHAATVAKDLAQYVENGIPIAFAGGGKGFVHG